MLYNVLVVSFSSMVLITAALELHETVKQVKPDDYVIQHYVRMIQRESCALMETDHLNLCPTWSVSQICLFNRSPRMSAAS